MKLSSRQKNPIRGMAFVGISIFAASCGGGSNGGTGPPASQADVVSGTSGQESGAVGGELTYTVTVTNNGPNAATAVVVSTALTGSATISRNLRWWSGGERYGSVAGDRKSRLGGNIDVHHTPRSERRGYTESTNVEHLRYTRSNAGQQRRELPGCYREHHRFGAG